MVFINIVLHFKACPVRSAQKKTPLMQHLYMTRQPLFPAPSLRQTALLQNKVEYHNISE